MARYSLNTSGIDYTPIAESVDNYELEEAVNILTKLWPNAVINVSVEEGS